MQRDWVFCIYLEFKVLHAHCCISLSSTLKVSRGVDEVAPGGAEVAPRVVCITCSLDVSTKKHKQHQHLWQREGELYRHIVYVDLALSFINTQGASVPWAKTRMKILLSFQTRRTKASIGTNHIMLEGSWLNKPPKLGYILAREKVIWPFSDRSPLIFPLRISTWKRLLWIPKNLTFIDKPALCYSHAVSGKLLKPLMLPNSYVFNTKSESGLWRTWEW